jgi:hypothetical protein
VTAVRQSDFDVGFVVAQSSLQIGGLDQQQSATFVLDTGHRLDAKIDNSH